MATVGVCYIFLLLLVAIIGGIRFKNITKPFKILTLLMATTFVLAVFSRIFALRYKNNISISHFEALLTYVFLSGIYYHLFKNDILKRAILYSIYAFVVFAFINAYYLQPLNKVPPTYIFIPTDLLYVLFSLLFFKQMLQVPINVNISRQSIFWFNIAVLFYSTTMFLNLGLTNYYAENNYMDYIIYLFWYAILYIFYILLGLSIILDRKANAVDYA